MRHLVEPAYLATTMSAEVRMTANDWMREQSERAAQLADRGLQSRADATHLQAV
jgi:hypothetical protein